MNITKCIPVPPAVKDITGFQYGDLTVLGFIGRRFSENSSRYLWLCKCSCGKKTQVDSGNLKSGHTKGCGHSRLDALREAKKLERTHGLSKHRIRKIYNMMLQRCNNPKSINYNIYGGRGISVCSRWGVSFENFVKDMGLPPSKTHQLERIDNNGNYTPENCTWASIKQQARNRRTNRLLTFMGETKCISEWAEIFGLSFHTLAHRLNAGWDIEIALTKPVNSTKNNSD